MGMGGAITAVSDDADSIFYNPAGLALIPRYEFHLLNPKIDVSSDLKVDAMSAASGASKSVSQFNTSTIASLFGQQLYGSASIFPSLVFPNFSMGYYMSDSAHIIPRNTALPSVDASYISDKGIIAGFGFETTGLSKKHFLRMGVSSKYLIREGFQTTIPLNDLVTASSAYFKGLKGGPATGISATAGIQYEFPVARSQNLILGSSWQDIGDTQFGGSIQSNRPPPIRNNLAAGLAYVNKFGSLFNSKSDFKLAAEMRNLTERNVDPRLQMHFGAELTVGMLSIQGGVNQDSPTGGVKLDLWFLEVSAVTYGVEELSLPLMERERRYLLQATLKFDIMGKLSRSKRDKDRREHPREY